MNAISRAGTDEASRPPLPIADARNTIFARASGAGKAGVAVFRVSGPDAFAMTERMVGALPAPRVATLRTLRDGLGEAIDKGLVILFPGPASFTGEDIAEFHLHGSFAVERALYEALAALGARAAAAGEFTRRALVSGKLDLAEVEGLADLLDAETALQRKIALGQLGGRLSALAEGWRGRLIAILAPLESEIDFPDEDGVPAAVGLRALPEIDALIAELETVQSGARRARAAREGVKIAIIGAPNAGKSSLLNALAGSDRAIVSELPGTTRDIVEARLDLGGTRVSLFDTAGLRDDFSDPVEAEGIRRTRIKMAQADLRLLVVDVSRETSYREDARYDLAQEGDLVIFNKIDANPEFTAPSVSRETFPISAKTGAGVGALVERLTKVAADLTSMNVDVGLTRVRHEEAVVEAISHLKLAHGIVVSAPELAAEDIRLAARSLGAITGAVGVEDVLGAIFSSFCIGK
ncbi:MAG: tRNA uridine-5-carboxymethylaminomethyl(34) synthesis GTPase MnmE [Parvularculaceae bacterium]|nr:tRNA uridine-5-carboxymethylaminomethyl(34) synthesis GTPase MnmE [Parvularculaceae bacterium]